jgi:hypothetical protein
MVFPSRTLYLLLRLHYTEEYPLVISIKLLSCPLGDAALLEADLDAPDGAAVVVCGLDDLQPIVSMEKLKS